jgi:integrase
MRSYKITPKPSEKIDLNILKEHCDSLDLSNNDDLNFWLYCQISRRLGLRSIDILNLKVENISFKKGRVVLIEKKTKKKVNAPLPAVVLEHINRNREYVIWNEKYTCRVSLMTINRRLKKVFEDTDTNVSSHSIRKACASKVYASTGNNIIKAMEFLNHTSPITTKNYLGISAAEKEELYSILD